MAALNDFGNVEFAENPEPRCPCVLLLDTSGSMSGSPIQALNEGLRAFAAALNGDSLASRRVEVAIVTFDTEVRIAQDFVTADQFSPPTLSAQGSTNMGGGISQALRLLEQRKSSYKANGVPYFRPWVFMLTDGAPDPGYEGAAREIQASEEGKKVAFFAVGVEGADMEKLSQIAVRPPRKLEGLAFTEVFTWLSASLQRVSRSKLDEQVALPPAGWATV